MPNCRTEGQYRHPGPKRIEFAVSVGEEGEWTRLNTKAHLRSVFFRRGETIILVDGEEDLGGIGYMYFIDWDHIRARKRTVQVQVMGA